MLNFDLVSLVLTIVVASFIVEGLIFGVLSAFNHEKTVITMFTKELTPTYSNVLRLFLKIFYLIIAFFTFTSFFVILLTNIGILII